MAKTISSTEQDFLYEEYGSKESYPCEVNCIICKNIIMYSDNDMTPVTDEVNLICPKCKGKLP